MRARRRRRPDRDVRDDPLGGLRRRGQAADHARHLRALLRLLRRLLRPGAEGAHPDRARTSTAPSPSVDFVVTPTAPSVAFRLGEKTDDPLAMYLNDFFTVPMSLAGIPAISIPAGLAEPEGGGPQLPVGFQIAAPGLRRAGAARRRLRARAGDRLRRAPGEAPMAELEAVIGLEIHVQLATKTKMFCGCELSFGDEPNVHTCPICLAHPGVLPVPNEQAIRYALQIGAGARAARSPRARSSTARTTSIPTARRPTRSASTTSRSAAPAGSATSASTAPTSRRTRRR